MLTVAATRTHISPVRQVTCKNLKSLYIMKYYFYGFLPLNQSYRVYEELQIDTKLRFLGAIVWK